MPSTYTSNNKIQKIATGEQSGTWGNTTNTNFDLFDTAIDGFVAVALTGTTHTLNIPDGTAADGRNKVISFTGTLAAANTVSITPNTVKKHYFVQNNTTGGQNVIISQGSGSTVTIKPGYSSIVYLNGAGSGASAKEVLTSLKLTALLEATGVVFVGSSSGNTTLQANATASGTLTLPAATDTLVGKATTDTFTNKTLDTAGAGNVLRINGTQVSAVTGTGSVVLATSPTLVTPLLGTPTSGTLTNCTGLPVSSGVSGLGANVATFLATPSSANLASAVTDETGTGALVFGTSPTIATPTITTSATVPLVIGGTGTTSTLTLRSTSGVGTTGADIIFQTGNNGATEVMRLQNGGNVGIGTSSPLTKLQVGTAAGGVGADGNTTLSAGTLMAYTTAASGAALTWNAYTNGGNTNTVMAQLKPRQDTSANYNLDVFCGTWNNNNDPGTAVATFQSTGYVGIGKTSPGTKLDVLASGIANSPADPLGVAASFMGASAPNGQSTNSIVSISSNDALAANRGGLLAFGGIYSGTSQAIWASIAGFKENATSGAFGGYLAFYTRANGANSTERMRIDSSGNVLIGYTTSNGAYLLQVNSQIFATNATIATSDGRYKENISLIKSGLDVVGKLNPVSFTWKQHEVHNFDSGTQVGFIAQDVQAALTDEPYLESVVKRNEVELKDGTKEEFYGLSDAKFIPILVKAIQELKAEIDILKARN